MYSLSQKECPKFLNEKSMAKFVVKFSEILHASTYSLYKWVYKAKKKPAAASARPPAAAARGRLECHSRALYYTT